MIVLGLTGSIGMGKSTAANMLRRLRVPVCDADAIVHDLIGPGGAAVVAVDDVFPGVVSNGIVDRAVLGAQVFGDSIALKRLEHILHPLEEAARDRFLKQSRRARVPVVALDIPLLYEVAADKLCDATIVLSAPPFVQSGRVLARPSMTHEKLNDILSRQMSDLEKRRRATFVIPSGSGPPRNLASVDTDRQTGAERSIVGDPEEMSIARGRSRYGNNRVEPAGRGPSG